MKPLNNNVKIIKNFMEEEISQNFECLPKYSQIQKDRIYNAVINVEDDICLEDILQNNKKWQKCNKFIEVVINTAMTLEDIGNITVNNFLYDDYNNEFTSQLSSNSLMAIAYYGVALRFIGGVDNIAICQNANCYNFYKINKNQHQCDKCMKNKTSKKNNDLKYKKNTGKKH